MSATISARDIAGRLNLRRYPRSWRGTCPSCSYRGAFAVTEHIGSQPRLWCANACSRDALNDAVERVIAGWRPTPPRDDESPAAVAARRAAKQAAALRLWSGSERCGHEAYLGGRGLSAIATSEALRFRADTPHPEGGRLPAMIALVRDAAGNPTAVHRTFLSRDHTAKADVVPAKASIGPTWGAAIRLHDTAPEIVIGEGIETAASAGLLLDLPAWAAISAGNLAKGVMLPAEIKSVVIAADPDPPGEAAARAAAQRWTMEGRTVRILRPNGGGDCNDILRNRPHG